MTSLQSLAKKLKLQQTMTVMLKKTRKEKEVAMQLMRILTTTKK